MARRGANYVQAMVDIRFFAIFILSLALASCSGSYLKDGETSAAVPRMSPDYSEVFVPCNIAPLNFSILEEGDKYRTCVDGRLCIKGKNVKFPLRKWKRILAADKGSEMAVSVFVKRHGVWTEFKQFKINVAEDPIDAYLTYRTIAPGYYIGGEMSIDQRCLENFKVRTIYCDSQNISPKNGQCVNCHSFQAYNADNVQLHLRMKDAGTVIRHNGSIKMVNLKRGDCISTGVYPSWHPHLPIIAYSTNNTSQFFFHQGKDKIEVLDEDSDIILYDIERDEVLPVLADSAMMETFPSWSSDGESLYYSCSDDKGCIYDSIRYDLYKVSYDIEKKAIGTPRKVFDASSKGQSATFARESPDGRWLLFSMASYGNFHIWHRDSDLYMMNLQTNEVQALDSINSEESESYHSWSSNGRWIVYSSRRGDGNHTRLYLSYFDKNGIAHKPFLLPQTNDNKNNELFKSYNIPEFTKGSTKLNNFEILKISRQQ